MKYRVEVPDNGNWMQSITNCEAWIQEQWPDMKRSTVGGMPVASWDYEVEFWSDTITYSFNDPEKAMLFKLAWK